MRSFRDELRKKDAMIQHLVRYRVLVIGFHYQIGLFVDTCIFEFCKFVIVNKTNSYVKQLYIYLRIPHAVLC